MSTHFWVSWLDFLIGVLVGIFGYWRVQKALNAFEEEIEKAREAARAEILREERANWIAQKAYSRMKRQPQFESPKKRL